MAGQILTKVIHFRCSSSFHSNQMVHILLRRTYTSCIRQAGVPSCVSLAKRSFREKEHYSCLSLFNPKNVHHQSVLLQICRSQSTVNSSAADFIPAPPPVPVDSSSVVENIVETLAEPSLASQGLCSWLPSGFVQWFLEYLHINLELPWWGSIILTTCIIRILMFPLIVKVQRNNTNYVNNVPKFMELQQKQTDAQSSGDSFTAARYAYELQLFMKEKGFSPFKVLLMPLTQAPIFVSVFFGIRQMANLPVESMKIGGIWWFTDLTVPDPLWYLPLYTSLTLYATIKVGMEFGTQVNPTRMTNAIAFLFPVGAFWFVTGFPAAMSCYWASANTISLLQTAFLKIPVVRDYFNIPIRYDHSDFFQSLKAKKKRNSKSTFKSAMDSVKAFNRLDDLKALDEQNFRKAGQSPPVLQKTYKHDPTEAMTKPKKKFGRPVA